jgi:hypothetical protein
VEETLKDESPDVHGKPGLSSSLDGRPDMATQISERGRELIKYVLDWHGNHQTDRERHIRTILIKREKNEFGRKARKTLQQPGLPPAFADVKMGVGEPRVETEVALGWDEIAYRIVFRILTAQPDLKIARCPRCHGALRTPLAEQCILCHHKWHAQSRG